MNKQTEEALRMAIEALAYMSNKENSKLHEISLYDLLGECLL